MSCTAGLQSIKHVHAGWARLIVYNERLIFGLRYVLSSKQHRKKNVRKGTGSKEMVNDL